MEGSGRSWVSCFCSQSYQAGGDCCDRTVPGLCSKNCCGDKDAPFKPLLEIKREVVGCDRVCCGGQGGPNCCNRKIPGLCPENCCPDGKP